MTSLYNKIIEEAGTEMTLQETSKDDLITEIQQLQARIIDLEAELIDRRQHEKGTGITDPLTELYSRRHFYNITQQEIERSLRYSRSLSLVMIGIDGFDTFTDQYGRAFADLVLQILSEKFQESFRGTDILGRYGDDKFTILLPETNLQQAHQACIRIQRKISGMVTETRQGPVQVTFSLGAASMEENLSLDRLTDRALQALQQAQRDGRNRIIIWEDSDQIGIL